MKKTSQTYFTYLDALRCLAFLAVFYAHSGTIMTGALVSSAFPLNIWNRFTVYGSYGVNFFFVLSGFLITFLLLREKESNGRISIRHFYRKRVLRIWPVYFMTLFAGAFVLPLLIGPETYAVFKMTNPHMSAEAFWYNLFFSGNFYQGMGLGMASLSIGILWSVCIEEQFYLVWPWIVKWFNLRTLAFVTSLLVSISFLYKFIWASDRMANYYLPWSLAMDLGFGCLLGISYYAKKSRRMFLTCIGVIGSCIVLTAGIMALSAKDSGQLIEAFRLLKTPILDSLFVVVIMFFIHRVAKIRTYGLGFVHMAQKTKEKIFSALTHLGKISYGLYAYHTICLMLSVQILFKLGFLHREVSRGAFFLTITTGLVLTIVAAELSFRYVEKRFLAIKNKA